jgi:hypothetical protein
MGRFVSLAGLSCIVVCLILLASCGQSSPTNVSAGNAVPTSVSLTASSAIGSNLSLEVGTTLALTATARGARNNVINETFSFLSSNPTVATVAANGFICAGTWDSLTLPQVCTPGVVGTTQITATAQGVSSPPITVYVHQRITSITVSKVPGQPATLSSTCLSKGGPSGPESWLYQATAMSGSNDITASVGPFSWQEINPGTAAIVNFTSPPVTSPLNQEIVSASVPGEEPIFAAASGFNGQPSLIQTCPVQSISIAAANNSSTAISVNTGTSTTLDATVTDEVGRTLTGVPLTWSSSNQISIASGAGISSNVFGSTFTATAAGVGAADVTASCTPPTCNAGLRNAQGFTPSLPIYAKTPITFTVTSSTAPANPTAYVTTTACASPTANPTNAACTPTIIPLTKTSTTATFTTGTPIALPASPNSFVFDPKGTNAYLGVTSSHFGQSGAMVFTGSAAMQFTSAFGTVLAISPDLSTVIFSDAVNSPNQVFICSNCSATGRAVTPLAISGATAAAFSPDSLKAYIVAGNNLYVYSKIDALRNIALTAAATDVAFLGNGMYGYLAGADAAGGASFPVCFDPAAGPALGSVTIPGAKMLRTLPGNMILALAPPSVETITASIGGTPMAGDIGCPAPRGVLTLSNSAPLSFDLGQGAIIPTQLIISSDGSTGYVLAQSPSPNSAPLPFVIVFSIHGQTTSQVSLTGNATPLSTSLSPAGNLLFVGADDGAVHIIDTALLQDVQQVTFPFASAPLCVGPGTPPTPVAKTVVGISGVSQNGSNWDYAYAVNSGPQLAVGETIVVTGMADGGNDGTFTVLAVGGGKFTVANTSGVATSSTQNGSGTVPITCNPDLVVVKP